ncbi:MAG TPA: TRIC cation channel family protein [Chloroflexota bacterium]|nr:TRIC cation channel family protein [Chloroflexota bacterium]
MSAYHPVKSMPPLDEFRIPISFDYLATFLWALSGAIVGMHKRYDITGVLVIALVASTGGSLLRDGLFLQATPPVLTNPVYIPLIILATIVVSFFRQRITNMVFVDRFISVIDAIGIPAFAMIGMQLSLEAGVPLPGVVLVGVVNGVGGGMLRDLLVGDTPIILKPGQYLMSALIVVCILFIILDQVLHVPTVVAAWGIVLLYFVIRMLSIRYNWQTYPVLRDPPS